MAKKKKPETNAARRPDANEVVRKMEILIPIMESEQCAHIFTPEDIQHTKQQLEDLKASIKTADEAEQAARIATEKTEKSEAAFIAEMESFLSKCQYGIDIEWHGNLDSIPTNAALHIIAQTWGEIDLESINSLSGWNDYMAAILGLRDT